MNGQQYQRLMASFTVSDKYGGNTGHIVRFSAVLKSPESLAATWVKAVARGRVPLQWASIEEKYWCSLNAI